MRIWVRLFVILIVALVVPLIFCSVADAKSIVVIAPHQDDEVLMTAGVIKTAVENGDALKVVLVTNGDFEGLGNTRIAESVNGLTYLGVKKSDIIFLGYGDTGVEYDVSFLYRLFYMTSPSQILQSNVGNKTYGNPSVGVDDYHYAKFGFHGSYNRATLLQDIQTILKENMPDDIYVTSIYDYHGDHVGANLFVNEAIINIKKASPNYSPILHEGIIHSQGGMDDSTWPVRNVDPTPISPFTEPGVLSNYSILDWGSREIVPVPSNMLTLPRVVNEKHVAISKYSSQIADASDYLYAFAKSDEIFWKKDYSNIALLANVTVSSENTATLQQGIKAIDGITDGYPKFTQHEWTTNGQGGGAWIQLTWPNACSVDKVVLFDRPNSTDQVISGTLSLSDGSTISVNALNNNGSGKVITFPAKKVTWVKFTIDQATAGNTGLCEFEVYGKYYASNSLGNVTGVTRSGDTLTISIGSNKMIVQVCEEGILRVDYQPGGVSDPDTVVTGNTAWSAVGAIYDTVSDPMTVTTNKMIVKISKNPCRISVYDTSNKLLIKEQDSKGVFSQGVNFNHSSGQFLYGLHGYNCFEETGRTIDVTNWTGRLASGYEGDSAGPFIWSTGGYGVLVDTADGQASVNNTEIKFSDLTKRDTEFYIMAGNPKEIMQMFARISGKPPMFPKKSLGFTFSKWGIVESDFREYVNAFRSKGIPVDSIGIDFDHINWGGTNYGEWNWNSVNYPNGAGGGLGTWANSQGVEIIGIRKPRIRMDSTQGNYATSNNYWHPLDPAEGYTDYFGGFQVGNLDFFKSGVRNWFWNYNKHFLLEDKVWCWWMDESDNDSEAAGTYDNQFSYYIAKMFYEKQRADSNKRVWTLYRTYYPGVQRFGYASWTADVTAGFYNMRNDPYAIFSSLNLGLTRMSQDSSGWQGDASGLEYARGIQTGAFFPIMRVHSDNVQNKLPWLYEYRAEVAAVNAIRLRYKLIPYLYTYEKIATDTGLSMMRPLFWEYPDDPNCQLNAEGWMLGDSLLVYPVMDDVGRKDIYLPEGTWIDYFRGTQYSGRQKITYTLSQNSWLDMPLFIRKGAIIPMMDVVNYLGEKPLSNVYLDIYPSTAQSSFRYYDDDGETYGYESNSYFAQTITAKDNASNISVNINAKEASGTYVPSLQYYICQIHGRAGSSVTSNGVSLTSYADLSALRKASGEGWAIGSSVNGPVTYVKIGSGIQKNIIVSGNASISGVVKYEAEDALRQNGVAVSTSSTGYSGLGYVSGYGSVGANTAFDVAVKNYGSYNVTLRYANATGSAKTISLYVNGTIAKKVSLPNLANWNTWGNKSESIKLTAGNNVISIKYDSGDTGGVYLDYINVPVNASVVDPDPIPVVPSPPSSFSGYYKIINKGSGKAMEVEDASLADGANILQRAYDGSLCQQWEIINIGGSVYKIINRASGKAVETENFGVNLGDNIVQQSYNDSINQKWIITDLGNGYFKIINKNSMKAAEVADEDMQDGGNIGQWTYVSSDFQQWQIVNISQQNPTTGTFINPIGPGADPYVIKAGGYYYLVGSDGGIFIKKAARLQDIAAVTPVTVWTPPAGQPYSQNIWAPEIHYLDGRWYIYFAADDGNNDNHRMYVLEGGTNPDNPLAAPFTFKSKIADATDQWAIDGTILENQGNRYFVWSGWPSAPSNTQHIYIAPMSNPWTISGDRIELSRPEYEWEIAGTDGVNEGPEVLIKNGTISIIYSADGSWTDEYCLGQIKFTGSDILSKSSWTKRTTPVFQKTAQVFGPGHCSFTKSPDGTEDWMVYHAAVVSGAGWDRNVRIQKFTWNADNTPNFGIPVNPDTSINMPSGTPSLPVPSFSGYYKIVNVKSGKVLEVADSSTADGAAIQQWAYDNVDCQKWQLVNIGGSDFKLVNKGSGKVIEVADNDTGNGAVIQQWTYGGVDCQKWIVKEMGNGTYQIINKNSNKALEITDALITDGALADQWSYYGEPNQTWQIISLP